MRIPTFDNLRAGARDILARFPFVLLAAVAAAVAGNILVDHSDEWAWLKLLLAAQLGIVLMFAIAVRAEMHDRLRPYRFVAAAVAAGALIVYGVTLPGVFTTVTITRHVQFTIGLHLLVAFAPFAGAGRLNGFWQYNRALFLRFCLSVFYSVVLYAGLTIALVAIDKLLGIEVDEKVYLRLWIVIAALFNTWIFVGGIPKDIPGLEGITDYTKGLRVFAQCILVPLVIIYLIILTIYLGKVIVTREWPSGWIGYLVSSVAVVGILAHLLVHPMRDDTGSQWVRTYSRWYYAAMIPAIVMLLLAVGKRIDQYGVTENRYLLAVLAAWLAVISVYFVVSRTRNIKLIPMTLCGLAFVTSFGPWGAFAVSKQSQMNRLTGLLESSRLLHEGTIQPAVGEVSFEDRKEISAVLEYVVTTHGPDDIAPWLGDRWTEIDTFSVEEYRDQARHVGSTLVRGIMREMNIEYVSKWNRPLAKSEDFYVSVDPIAEVYPLEDADVMVRIHAGMESLEIDGSRRTISWNDGNQALLIGADGDTLTVEIGRWINDLLPELTGLAGQGTITFEQACLSAENDRVHAVIHVRTIDGRALDGDVHIRNMDGICLIRWKH